MRARTACQLIRSRAPDVVIVDWQMPDDEAFTDYAKLTTATKKKILGLNAAKLYGIEVPEEFQIPDEAGEPAAREDAQLVDSA